MGVEYVQNLPISLGLIFALRAETWPLSLAWMGIGALATAGVIAATEPIKLATPVLARPLDTVFNALGFFFGGALYLGYNSLIRVRLGNPLLGDVAAGVLLGLLVGIVQARFVDERKITREAIAHTGALILAAILVFGLIGAAASWHPLVAAAGLCLLMTLVIVWVDYRVLIAQKPISQRNGSA
jgi:hypothetical protein